MKKMLFLALALVLFISCAGKPSQSILKNNEAGKVQRSSRVKDKMVVNGNYSYAGMSVAYVLLENGKILVFSNATQNPLSVTEARSLFSSGVNPGCALKIPEKEDSNVRCYAVFKGNYSYASVDVVYVLYKGGRVCHYGNYTNLPFSDEEAKILLSPIGCPITYYE